MSHATTAPDVTVQAATQVSRAEALWQNRHEAERLAKAMEDTPFAQELREKIALQETLLKRLQSEYQKYKDEHAYASRIKEHLDQVAILTAQFLESYQVGDAKTVETTEGDKVQVRERRSLIIEDHKAVAHILLEKDLWDAAQAKIEADDRMLGPLVKNGVLGNAAHIEEKRTIAFFPRKE